MGDSYIKSDTLDVSSVVTQLIRLADDHLILGHRLSEWCGHAPMLEEDLAMPNIALDLIGQARALYSHAGKTENKGRDEDNIAYNRLEREYTNLLICERPNGDFAHTMLRQLLFSLFMEKYWQASLSSTDDTITAIAGKAVKESTYHVRHTAEWVIRLGDGTDESARRTAIALEQLTPYVNEFFEVDPVTQDNADHGLLPDPASCEASWRLDINEILSQANVTLGDYKQGHTGGRSGAHTEAMGFLLAELQFLQRSHPNLQW
ncbi:MAG: ring-1,2-phenylacetyl-CoA epoxidase subunit PaaC [Porticoccaceae bacterium]|jgi:ring-1,2-phenylacetyl-CoA epoxidase subunit PaaC